MGINDINLDILKQYLKVDNTEDDLILNLILSSAKAYIKSDTGLTEEEINSYEDLTIALLVLCNDMFGNREYTVNNEKINPIIDSILSMHRVNLL